jgi:Cellulase (glycosyl hydrolase family 5)
MMLLASVAFLALVASPARAWIPGEHREIYAQDGTNLFNNTALGGNATTKRWLQASGKVRGVNLGSLFVFEPWLAETEWSNMGCDGKNSEFDCVSALGQTQANSVFQTHWNSWITQADIAQMQSYGLNTIRVPVGYWMMESIVYADSEHFPQGGIGYLEQLCGWASDAGFYIIIDLHGAPGAQVATNPDTGQVSLPEICNSSSEIAQTESGDSVFVIFRNDGPLNTYFVGLDTYQTHSTRQALDSTLTISTLVQSSSSVGSLISFTLPMPSETSVCLV